MWEHCLSFLYRAEFPPYGSNGAQSILPARVANKLSPNSQKTPLEDTLPLYPLLIPGILQPGILENL
jgi:hypothetical protein